MSEAPKFRDKDWLYEQYVVQKKSLSTIARELGVSSSVIAKYAKRYNLPMRSRGESRALTLRQLRSSSGSSSTTYSKVHPLLQDREWLYQKYVVEGLAMRTIANLVGLSNRRVLKRALKLHCIPVRSFKEARHNRTARGRDKRRLNPKVEEHREEIVSSYMKGESIRSIRLRLSLSRDAVHRVLREAGVHIRDSGQANVGRRHSPETLAKMSSTARDQILCGVRCPVGNGRRVNCLTPRNGFVTMRSTWEKKYADHLRANGVDFLYEHKAFHLSNGKNYVADFYLPETDEYVEIKGFLSEEQRDKYNLFKKEYPHVKWKILCKEDLLSMGIDLKKDIPTIYLLIGAPGAGKSWVAKQLTHKFKYVSYDENPKKDHLTLLRQPTDKPIIYDPTFKISTFIRRHSHEFDIRLVAIRESEDTLRERIESRGGKWTPTIAKRNLDVQKRFEKYGSGGFIGTSEEVLRYLDSVIE